MFENGAVLDLGSTISDKALANTLRKIASDPNDFYNGSLAESIVQDIQSKGGIISLDDLANYKVVPRKVLETDLGDYTLHTMPSPTGGPIVSHILNIIKGMLIRYYYFQYYILHTLVRDSFEMFYSDIHFMEDRCQTYFYVNDIFQNDIYSTNIDLTIF